MDKINTIQINTNYLIQNIQYIKKQNHYTYYIMNVSNNAFCHGMYLIKRVKGLVDYLYVNDFYDLLLIRKYDKDIPVIYDGDVTIDNIYDLIINNAIVVIRDIHLLERIHGLNIKDDLDVILEIDPEGLRGIANKQDILDYLEVSDKHIQILGVKAHIKEDDYEDFKYIVRPINNSSLMILNSEEDKRKIQGSNAIILDASFYGINEIKKKLFQKVEAPLKQIFRLTSKVANVKVYTHKNKEKYIAVIPFGYHHGMNDAIKNVYIENKLYSVDKVTTEFTYILGDENIKIGMDVEITSVHNPLENYISNHTLNYFSLFHSNIPILFDDYILEKTLIY